MRKTTIGLSVITTMIVGGGSLFFSAQAKLPSHPTTQTRFTGIGIDRTSLAAPMMNTDQAYNRFPGTDPHLAQNYSNPSQFQTNYSSLPYVQRTSGEGIPGGGQILLDVFEIFTGNSQQNFGQYLWGNIGEKLITLMLPQALGLGSSLRQGLGGAIPNQRVLQPGRASSTIPQWCRDYRSFYPERSYGDVGDVFQTLQRGQSIQTLFPQVFR